MASSLSTFSISGSSRPFLLSPYPQSAASALQFQFPCIKSRSRLKNSTIFCISSTKANLSRRTKVRAMAEEGETLGSEEDPSPPPADDQTVSVAVSPSDLLTMFFQADGTMADSAIPKVTKALEEVEGISDLKVQVVEGIASVELTKQTTVQATGVASSLVEIIQGSGFKLQTLNLSFQDEEDLA